MLLLQMFSMALFILSLVFILISLMLSKKNNLNQEKTSQFECGYNPLNFGRLPFSSHFFIISIIFLIFDVELSLLLPMSSSFNNNYSMSWVVISLMFMTILIVGTLIEWKNKALDWQ